jgi:nitroreductase
MLKEHLKHRFTAKWWNNTPVEQEKIDAVLEAAYLAPSKQGVYRYQIVAVTDSQQGKDLKKWLYEENTWCFDGMLTPEGADDKRFNGQVLAPVLLIYFSKKEKHNSIEDLNLRNHIDTVVSASTAMCAAEELGLATGFNATFNGQAVAERLGITDAVCTMMLGFGYATADQRVRRGVFDQTGNRIGYDYSNTDPELMIDINRTNKPSLEDLIKIV